MGFTSLVLGKEQVILVVSVLVDLTSIQWVYVTSQTLNFLTAHVVDETALTHIVEWVTQYYFFATRAKTN